MAVTTLTKYIMWAIAMKYSRTALTMLRLLYFTTVRYFLALCYTEMSSSTLTVRK